MVSFIIDFAWTYR